MKSNFEKSLELVLVHEGGFVNHPKDPGGATNQGITQRTYDAWRSRQGQVFQSVRHINADEIREIYRAQYWHKVSADDLPAGLDYAVFDFAVNSGPARAAKFLQKIAGVPADGIIGAQTLAAVGRNDAAAIITRLCRDRLAWLKRLKTFSTFGRGWTRRVNEVQEAALSMFADRLIFMPKETAQGRGDGDETATAAVSDMAKDPKAWAAGAGLIGSLGGIMQGTGPVQWALAVALVAGVVVAAVVLMRKAAQ